MLLRSSEVPTDLLNSGGVNAMDVGKGAMKIARRELGPMTNFLRIILGFVGKTNKLFFFLLCLHVGLSMSVLCVH